MYIELTERYTNSLTDLSTQNKKVYFFEERNIAKGISNHGVYFMCEGNDNFDACTVYVLKIEDGSFDVYEKKFVKLGESFECKVPQTEGGLVSLNFELKDDKNA